MKKNKLLKAKIIELPLTAFPKIERIAKKQKTNPKNWIETIILNALKGNANL